MNMILQYTFTSEEDDPICGGIILLFIGLGMMLMGVNRYLLLQKINNTPTSKVRSAAVGLVELYGTALCDEEVYSPLSGAKCVYYRLSAEYYYHSRRHSGWEPFFFNEYGKKFYLQDETGKMLIDPAGAEVAIPLDKQYEGYINGQKGGIFGIPRKQIEPEVIKFIENASEPTRRLFMRHNNDHIRISEYYIAEGDKVYVLGTAEPIPGKASPVAHENLIVKKGRLENVMYITDTHESNLTKNLQSAVLVGLFGGLAMAAIGLAVIFWRIGIL